MALEITEDYRAAMQKFLDSPELYGTYMAKPTGKVLEEDSTYIEVLIYGRSYYAKPCMAFGNYAIPNTLWLEKFKDEIMVWVTFENGNPAHPVYMGVCPLDTKDPGGNYPYTHQFKTTEFVSTYDDKNKTFELGHISGAIFSIDGTTGEIKATSSTGQGIIAGKITTLGDGNGAEPLVLGTQISTWLTELLTGLISADIIVGGVPGNFGPGIIGNLTNLQAKITTILSKSVFTN